MPQPSFDVEHDYQPPTYTLEEVQSLQIKQLHFLSDHILFLLSDEKALCVPLSVSPPLEAATQEERYQWQLIDRGRAVLWNTERLEVRLSLWRLLEHPDAKVGELAESSSPFPPLLPH
jgi:hypothetical protein